MGATPSHNDDGAPPPPPQQTNFQGGRNDWRRSLGVRPGHPSVHPVTHEGPIRGPSGGLTRYPPPNNIQQVEAREPIQHSSVVSNVINVHKNSLRLNQSTDNRNHYYLQFTFDAQVEGHFTVYFCAKQAIHRIRNSASLDAPITKLSYVAKGDRTSGKTPFSAGLNQTYKQNENKPLDVSLYSKNELENIENETYPIVIRMETNYASDTTTLQNHQIKCQTSFATLNQNYEPKLVAQQVLVNGTIYKILELYGIGGRDVTATVHSDKSYNIDSGDECVVCLTEPCTIAVEPCNHLCLCEDCANTLGSSPDRNMRKCPVCRSEIVRFIPFVPPPPPPPTSSTPLQQNNNIESIQQHQHMPVNSSSTLTNGVRDPLTSNNSSSIIPAPPTSQLTMQQSSTSTTTPQSNSVS